MVLSHDEKEAIASSLTFMKKLSIFEYNLFTNNLLSLSYGKGKILHHGGADCSGLLYIKEGRLRTFILSGSGKKITLFRLLDGDICILSASCAFRNITFDVHVEAETDCSIYLLPTAAFQQLEDSNPAVRDFGSNLIAARFSEVMWVIEQVVFMSMDKRLALFLLDQASLADSRQLEFTHDAIARNLGSAREVVTRLLKYFASEGLVSLSRGKIILNDIIRLRILAEPRTDA